MLTVFALVLGYLFAAIIGRAFLPPLMAWVVDEDDDTPEELRSLFGLLWPLALGVVALTAAVILGHRGLVIASEWFGDLPGAISDWRIARRERKARADLPVAKVRR